MIFALVVLVNVAYVVAYEDVELVPRLQHVNTTRRFLTPVVLEAVLASDKVPIDYQEGRVPSGGVFESVEIRKAAPETLINGQSESGVRSKTAQIHDRIVRNFQNVDSALVGIGQLFRKIFPEKLHKPYAVFLEPEEDLDETR